MKGEIDMNRLILLALTILLFVSMACAGTITDSEKNLMWIPLTKNSEMVSISGVVKQYKKLNDENAYGYNNWRIPTEDEILKTINIHKGNYWVKDGMFGIQRKVNYAIDTSTGLKLPYEKHYFIPVRQIRRKEPWE
jgi:hypothetical protein